MRIVLFLLIVLVSYLNIKAERKPKPFWTDYMQRNAKLPKSAYVVGYAAEENYAGEVKSELLDRVKSHSRTQLVESIHVSIKSMTTTSIEVENTMTNDLFRQTSVSLSSVNLQGMTCETFYDDKEDIAYAISYAKKRDVSKLYRNLIKNTKNKIAQNIENGKSFYQTGNNQAALKSYYACMPLFREVEEAQTLIIFFENLSIEAPELFITDINELKKSVFQEIRSLQRSDNLTLNDVAYFLSHGLKIQLSEKEAPILLMPLTYQDTKTGCEFTKRFSIVFEQKLVKEGFNILQPNYQTLNDTNYNYSLSGTYWEEGSDLHIIVSIHDKSNGRTIASAESLLPVQWLEKNNMTFKPQKNPYLEKLQQNTISNSGLVIDVMTNKGPDNVVFTEGLDTMKFYIKANRECYIRLVYYLAEGSKVLMLDNLFIDKTKVNKFYELPDKFEPAAPFGVEVLQCNAQTESFKPLQVKEQYGYKFIVEDIEHILANTRGFKPIEDKAGVAEKKITITTLPRFKQ